MRIDARQSKKGVVLIFTICMLPMMAVLGLVFVTTSRVERSVSASYLAGARARMLAISGVDCAAARLRTVQGVRPWSSIRDAWYCPDPPSTPIASLARPSFGTGAKSFGFAWSVESAGTYVSQGDLITLRVTDCASRIHVNGRQATLGRMLDSLGWAVAAQDGVGAPADGWGDRFVAARDAEPGRAIQEEAQLRRVLSSVTSKDMADRLLPYLTLYAWTDASVIAPKPVADGPATEAVQQPDFQKDATGAVVGRAPVDVNTAPVPVLVACLAGLQGEELTLSGIHWQFRKTAAIPRDLALKVARLIDGYRQKVGDLRTWEEMNAFLDGLAVIGVVTQAQADSIKANANPNADLNRLNPNREVTLRVQKNDLTFSTTEFSFDAMGYFRIESLSRILGQDGGVVASSHVVSVVKVYDVERISSQAQFEAIRQSGGAPSVISVPEHLLAQGGAIDRSKRPCRYDGQLVPAPAPTNANGGTVLYDLRSGLGKAARMANIFAPRIQGVTEKPSVFTTAGARESDVLADGLCLDSLRRRIDAYPIDCLRQSDGNVKDGTVEYFVKWSRFAPNAERMAFHGLVAKWRVKSIALIGSIDWLSRHRLLGLGNPSDPRALVVYGANGFQFLGKLNIGYKVNSDSPGVWNAFETGTWHHVAVAWRDGFVTNLYFDGTKVLGDKYDEGGKAKNKDLLQRLLVGCDVDTMNGSQPNPRTAYFVEGTIDGVVATKGKKYDKDFTPPRRYDARPAVFRGTVPFRSERPTAVLRSAAFTAYVPRKDARGRALAPGAGPTVSVRVQPPGAGWVQVKDAAEKAADSPGRGVALGGVIASGQGIALEVSFTSTDVTAMLDDVTLTSVDDLKFLAFQID